MSSLPPYDQQQLAAARTRLDAFLAENRRLGRTITRTGLVAALSPPGVHRVDLALGADVVCDSTEAAGCVGIGLTHAGYAA